jgi:primosomal protein N' (replication factor Y)
MQVQVLIPTALNQTFTYEHLGEVVSGQVVFVPFRNKIELGVIWDVSSSEYSGVAKSIDTVTKYILPESIKSFVEWVADYTMTSRGLILKMVLALPLTEFRKILKKPYESESLSYTFTHSLVLSREQEEAAYFIQNAQNKFQPFLLDGVTGSGKTEVYLSVIENILKKGGQALVLLPEIALTTQWLERFEKRFGVLPMLWHSGVTTRQKREAWQRIVKGEVGVVVGARSALFLPFSNLKIIIVDEEHDASYKQEEQVLYHARDMAVLRAQQLNIPIVLASATPSIETLVNAQKDRYKHLVLADRFAGAQLPSVAIVDMRQQQKGFWLSEPLFKSIKERLKLGEQSLLFLNRRGYAPLTLCRKCGYRFMCPGCDAWLVQHKNVNQLRCHHCGFYKSIPNECPECPECQNAEALTPCGPGVERIHEEVTARFPEARVLLAASDLISTPQEIKGMIEQIEDRKVDVIIGTQMLAKGHHFPFLTLVGVVDADLGLNGSDLRAAEKTYQLLHQVSGRAGRETREGEVLLQTFNPNHPIMQALKDHNREQFYEYEIHERQTHQMPPFGRLAAVILSALDADQVQEIARKLAKSAPNIPGVRILGPVPAPIARVRSRHRWRFLVKAERTVKLQPVLKEWLDHASIPKSVRISVDIDPQSFM